LLKFKTQEAEENLRKNGETQRRLSLRVGGRRERRERSFGWRDAKVPASLGKITQVRQDDDVYRTVRVPAAAWALAAN